MAPPDELPGAPVARVAPGTDEVLTLAATLEHLARDPDRRRGMGAAALENTRTVLDPARSADADIEALLAPTGRWGLEESLRRSLAHSIGEVRSVFDTPTGPLVQEVGEAAGGIGLLSRADR